MAPPQGKMRPGRQLTVLGFIFVVLAGLVFFVGAKDGWGWRERLAPRLGLDLVGGTRVTLAASTLDGRAPDAGRLEQARRIIESRVNSLGVSEVAVVTEGDRNIVVSVPGQSNDQIKQVGVPAQLRFRKVVNQTQDTPGEPGASATADPASTTRPGLDEIKNRLGNAYRAAEALRSPPDLTRTRPRPSC